MFSGLADFGMQRSLLQAVGFYFAYFVLTFVVVELIAIASALVFRIPEESAQQVGSGIGSVVASISCIALSYLVLKQKKLLRRFSSIVYIIAAGGLGLIVGALGGLILVAFLTTREKA